MNRYLCVTLVVLVSAAAWAAPDTTKPNGPLVFYTDGTGVGTMVNDGLVPFVFDGYTISSPKGKIAGEAVTGIFDNALADMVTFPGRLGMTAAEALGWTEMSTTATNYSEVTMGMGATLQPGDAINLGQAFFGPREDFWFTYVDSIAPGSYDDGHMCTEVLELDPRANVPGDRMDYTTTR